MNTRRIDQKESADRVARPHGEQVFYQTACVPISRLVRTYLLVDTLADRRQLINENSETICSRLSV